MLSLVNLVLFEFSITAANRFVYPSTPPTLLPFYPSLILPQSGLSKTSTKSFGKHRQKTFNI